MTALSVVVPNRINNGRALPSIKTLVEGMKLPKYATDGSFTVTEFTRNPAWIILDVLRQCGWNVDEIDMPSFARAAAFADGLIQTQDLHGNPINIPRFECNVALKNRRSAGDLIRGIRNACRLYLTYGADGLLELNVENAMALQQPSQIAWSNSTSAINGGWASYEFGDGSSGVSGILRRPNGEPTVKLWCRSITDTPNRLAVEFQDSLNEYQQDSYSVTDIDDVIKAGQEITVPLKALGIPNYDQAARMLKFNLDKSIRGNTYIAFETTAKALGLRPGDLITVTYLKEGLNRQTFRILKIAHTMNFGTAAITAQIHDDAWYGDTNGQISGNSGARRQPGAGVGVPRPLIGSLVDADGVVQFGVSEVASQASDGSQIVQVTVQFSAPGALSSGGPAIPLLSLAASVSTSGGSIAGGKSLYYAVSAVNNSGLESNISFVVRATIPAGSNTNSVTLTGLSFPAAAVSFHVYRGLSPMQLYRIADGQPLAGQFTDSGLTDEIIAPPDSNYDHSNFYWRLEQQPEYVAATHSSTSIGNLSLQMVANAYRGMVVRVTRGKGRGQERSIASNTATALVLNTAWDMEPDGSSSFVVAESGWRFGAGAKASPVQFEIPNRAGNTIHITGRAANTNDAESPVELSTVTRWMIGGSGAIDADVPGAPFFGFGTSAKGGTIELVGVSFSSLTNTRTITAGTLTVHYWPELNGAPQLTLSSAIDAQGTSIDLSAAGGAQPGSFIQLGGEVARVEQVLNSNTRYQVTRGVHGSTAAAHAAGTLVYELVNSVYIVPFVRDFFGSPASGSWSYPIFLPDSRIASAELSVTNIKGASPTGSVCLTSTVDFGLRTLSSGQFSFQVDAFLAIETGATADLIVEDSHSVRDVYAVLRQGPSGGPVQLQINQNGVAYCSLTIPDGATVSNSVSGFSLPSLTAGSRLSLDITAVGTTSPGADLTVIMRL